MAPRTDLQAAWRALGENVADEEGWRTIPVESAGPCRIRAGRRFEGGDEALLIGFLLGGTAIDASTLPRGRGFRVELDLQEMPGDARTWVALVRESVGSREIFARMAEDVIDVLSDHAGAHEDLFRRFTARIRAWQSFMDRGGDEVLGPAAEVGLVGELSFLQQLLESGVPTSVAVDGWRGPLDGLHDFVLGNGAMEVKASVASGEFPALVGSLEQLDESLVQGLYLVGVHLVLDASGRTLPALVGDIGDLLRDDPALLGGFEDLVLQAGFLVDLSNRYRRKFRHDSTVIFSVDEGFPRLSHANVARAIRTARYELNLEMVQEPRVELMDALAKLQVI